jgi:hypothetical protein
VQSNDAKICANAAGAIGNMARNGPQLCAALLRYDALKALSIIAFSAGFESSQRRISLFSLGTVCAFDICREALMHNEGTNVYTLIEQLESQSVDKCLSRYASRLRMKLTR